MLQYLWNKTDKSYKKKIYPRKDYVKHIFDGYLSYIKSYYSSNNHYVKRPNKLVTLIESLSIDLTKTNTDVFLDLDTNSMYNANTIGFVTNINKNLLSFKNTIVDKTIEYIIINNYGFNYLSKDDCKDSLKCIYNNSDEVLMGHPKVLKLEDKTFIYTLNVTKLGMSYYYWAKEQLKIDKDIDTARFVYENILTEVIDSILDVSIFNRYINISNDIIPTKFTNYNAIGVVDLSLHIDKMYKWVLKHYKNKDITYEEYLINIPLITTDTALDLIKLPYIQTDKRNKWALYISRFDYILHLLENVNNKRNKDGLTRLKKSIIYDRNEKVFMINKEKSLYFRNILSKIDKLI